MAMLLYANVKPLIKIYLTGHLGEAGRAEYEYKADYPSKVGRYLVKEHGKSSF
jgi:hypothetical protein